MKAFEVWYSCYEDRGVLGRFMDKADAVRCFKEAPLKLGDWINGDCIQAMGIEEINIQEKAE